MCLECGNQVEMQISPRRVGKRPVLADDEGVLMRTQAF
jgi:hypothetical protein